MGNCCVEFYALLSKSEYEAIVDEEDERCRAYSNITMSTFHSEAFAPEDESAALPPQFSKFYQMGALVGVGTTAKVYQVYSKLNKKTEGWEEESLACKIIDKQKIVYDVEDQDVDGLLEQLGKEVDILKRIKHQNIVQFYDYMETKDRLYIITERLKGGELFEYILNNGPLSENFARQVLFGVFSAVAYLHERGVVHRDIKAENLIFFQNQHGEIALKLIDFGFSTVLRHSMTGSFMGTGGYIAPEIRQNKNYSTSVDSWSLGVLLYCSLGARLPFGVSMEQLPSSVHDCRGTFELKFPPELFGSVSAPCKDLIARLLEIDPNRRATVKEALLHPWFQSEYRRAKNQEAQRPTRSRSSDTLAESALGQELPLLRPHLRPTLSMSAIERNNKEHTEFKSTGRNKAERTNSVGDYDMLTSSQDAALLRERIERSKYLSREQIYPSPSNLSASLGCFEELTLSSGSGSTSSADGLSGDPLTPSSTESMVIKAHTLKTHHSALKKVRSAESVETFAKDAVSPRLDNLLYASYQHGTSPC